MIVVCRCKVRAPYGTTIILRKHSRKLQLEALFLPFGIQFTTKCCQKALMYKKVFLFSNQMILNLFTTIWLTSKDPKTSFGTGGLRGGSTVD